MDPATMVTAALTAGATAGLKDTASAAVKDAYVALKAIVLRRVHDTPAGTVAIEQQEFDPLTWQAPVAKILEESGAADDLQVVELAQQLLALVRSEIHNTTTILASAERAVAVNTNSGVISTGDYLDPHRTKS